MHPAQYLLGIKISNNIKHFLNKIYKEVGNKVVLFDICNVKWYFSYGKVCEM